jgi:hypothetical protein
VGVYFVLLISQVGVGCWHVRIIFIVEGMTSVRIMPCLQLHRSRCDSFQQCNHTSCVVLPIYSGSWCLAIERNSEFRPMLVNINVGTKKRNYWKIMIVLIFVRVNVVAIVTWMWKFCQVANKASVLRTKIMSVMTWHAARHMDKVRCWVTMFPI